MIDQDMKYLRACLSAAPLVAFQWDGEDKNLCAFRSKTELVTWYGQPPGKNGEPYRDRGFYCRELAMLSRVVQPKTIVEFGTSLGIGTCLLHWLNPTAALVTVDVNTKTYMPGNVQVPMGHLARHNNIPCEFVTQCSWHYTTESNVGLCLIDGDHSYAAVEKDSKRAWINRRVCGVKHSPSQWAIAWHDYNDRHPGVVRAVNEFCAMVGEKLQERPDSDTVWIMGE